jgi:uncharacterized membrane protein YoaK (UPF0700 family)
MPAKATTRALLVLTFVAGMLDAATFIGLGFVFATIVTGNIVVLGFAIGGADAVAVTGPLVAVLAFMAGAYCSRFVAASTPARRRGELTAAVIVEVTLLGIASLLAGVLDVEADNLPGYAVIATIAVAIGVRTAIVARIGVPELATTVITTPLVELVTDAQPAGRPPTSQGLRATSVLALLAGAIAGALLVDQSLFAALIAATLISAACGLYLSRAR